MNAPALPLIAIDARELRTTTGRYVERLLHYLQRADAPYRYVVLLKPKDMAGWRPSHPRFATVACPYREFSFGEQLGLARQLTRLRPDLVHFPMAQQPLLYRGAVVTSIMDLTTARFVNPAKNRLVFGVKQAIYRGLVRRVAARSRRLITLSDYVKHDLQAFAHMGLDKVTTTYLAADAIAAAPEPVAALAGAPFIMYVGRPQPHKNLHALIDAYALARARLPALRLAIAGSGDVLMDGLQAYARARGLGDGVVFTGYVSEGQLRWLYEHTAAYVFPSLSEGFGLPGLEAMVHGAPVVASDASCLPEIYGDGAHYFPPRDTAAMAQAILDVVQDPARAAALVAAGRAVAARYSWQRCASQTLAVYDQALRPARTA
ncbi:glycosyltransferase family 4 protein [Duganella sp. LX20W]|uniref:Glycosyltransferase family 4 protein n=1 Tax=Rugamonas brunnea TaxID=2758569 RepID=A0A7W2IE77_9BURK|nr:glycosyltransferase family 1 protein [Rugamonas brunnea]MBA5640035.1 glycosyltransferase family 4 protein [Rugamonas brunnea]